MNDAAQTTIQVGELSVDPGNRAVTVSGNSVYLTTAEFELLHFLAQHPGEVISRDLLYQNIRGIEYNGSDRSLDLRVSQLRKKLSDDAKKPCRIITIRGVGYLLANHQ